MNFDVKGTLFDLDARNVSLGMYDRIARGECTRPTDVIQAAVELARPDERPLLSAIIPDLSLDEATALIEDVVAKTAGEPTTPPAPPAVASTKVPWLDRRVDLPLGYLIAVLALFTYDALHDLGIAAPTLGGALMLLYIVLMGRLLARAMRRR